MVSVGVAVCMYSYLKRRKKGIHLSLKSRLFSSEKVRIVIIFSYKPTLKQTDIQTKKQNKQKLNQTTTPTITTPIKNKNNKLLATLQSQNQNHNQHVISILSKSWCVQCPPSAEKMIHNKVSKIGICHTSIVASLLG